MCPGLILGLGSEFWTQIWKVGFIYFIVTSFFFFPSQICSFFWLSSVALCEPLFLLLLYHPSDFSLSPLPCISTSYPFHSFFPIFIYSFSYFLSFSPLPSIHPPLLPARVPRALYGRHHAPPLTSSLPERLPCPTDTTRCSHPPKTTSNSQRHQSPQSVSQAASEPASQPSAST